MKRFVELTAAGNRRLVVRGEAVVCVEELGKTTRVTLVGAPPQVVNDTYDDVLRLIEWVETNDNA